MFPSLGFVLSPTLKDDPAGRRNKARGRWIIFGFGDKRDWIWLQKQLPKTINGCVEKVLL
jgi:hypothetical protein